MEHRGVRFELRRPLGNDEWVWTVYTPAPKQGNVSGDRYFAMQRAMSVIDRWCGHDAESVPPQGTQEAAWGGMTSFGARIDPAAALAGEASELLQLLRRAQILPEMRQGPERLALQFGIVAALGVGVEQRWRLQAALRPPM